ncbi:hypothetical protein [Dokdonia sp.]|uniref:hypothetical protein n=1 Tax=Dokdonia sp. TaxID=2024995 RepID=UPI003266A399
MKKIKLLFIAILVTAFTSCDDDSEFGSGIQDSDPSIVSLSQSSANLSIEVGETREMEFSVNASKLSNNARTINLLINEASTLNPDSYVISTTNVTIPANEFSGSFTVTITDPTGFPALAENLILDIEDSSDYTTSTILSSLTIRSGILGPFSGSYKLDVIEGVFPGFGATGSYETGRVIDIEFLSLNDRRITDLCYLPSLGSFCGPFDFSIDGNQIVVPLQAPGGGVGCGAALLAQSFSDDQASIDLDDDSSFQIIFQDNVDNAGGCDVDPYRVVFELTKQ